ncbi:putative hydrolase or acyltransferase of alpha/beta superfamily [Caulobacter sp. AP07]|uniref:alpha/beta fold hydrolase n=1 Tax=Caulobacter sp. AP07 TaxID=1144304 RepID=UPI000271F2B7|nr:alpha/beta hydrolase [Caulobacter sp. AP07]EJL30673.1 putative hydrolase or acyltransferase of alpha/beta superfamily [Caulobacter sp. AP07]
MPKAPANGIEIEYETFGPETGEPLLLIMGLGQQLTRWPVSLIDRLVGEGFRVIRFDNRDIGLSTGFDQVVTPDLPTVFGALAGGQDPGAPYLLADMADDAAGLLGALGIARAHVAGVSMGGMIGQMLAARHPGKVLSLVSVMSTTGNPAVPPASPEAQAVLFARPAATDLDSLTEHALKAQVAIQSPAWPVNPQTERPLLRAAIQRAYHPAGVLRQMIAVIASGDRREALKTITAPTVVLHGADDPLVRVEGGKDTAATIPGAELRIIDGMGHDLPAAVHDAFIDAVNTAAARARQLV